MDLPWDIRQKSKYQVCLRFWSTWAKEAKATLDCKNVRVPGVTADSAVSGYGCPETVIIDYGSRCTGLEEERSPEKLLRFGFNPQRFRAREVFNAPWVILTARLRLRITIFTSLLETRGCHFIADNEAKRCASNLIVNVKL